MVIVNVATGRTYDQAEIERIRAELERLTNLDLSTMSDKSVIANAAVRGIR